MAPKNRRRPAQNERAGLIRAAFVEDFAETEAFIRQRTGHLVRGPMGFLLNPLVAIFFSFLQEGSIQKMARRQVDLLLKIASVPDEQLEEESRRRLGEYLRWDEVHQRVNPRHPRYPLVRQHLEDFYFSRVTFVWSLLYAEGRTFPELVRSAYPRRKSVELLLVDQLKTLGKILKLARSDPDLFRIPGPFRKEVLQILYETYDFSHDLMRLRLDEIYGRAA